MDSAYRAELYLEDQTDYLEWLSVAPPHVVDTEAQFARWINWRLSIGTTALDNLPQRKRDHTGVSCAPCPYDTQADDARSEIMLGSVPSKVDHGTYYMKVAQRGTAWGFECTYSGCPYLLSNGIPYFYA
jgi:hypothetical protein